jgi:hypothetical protein
MREVLASAEQRIESIEIAVIQDVEMEELLIRWSQPLHADERLCPDSPYNEIDRTRGQVDFAPLAPGEEGLLFVQTFDGRQDPLLRRVDRRADFARGTYRYSVWSSAGALVREMDYDLRFALEKRVLDPQPLAPAWQRELVPVPDAPTGFLASARFVTWRDLALVFSAAELREIAGKALSFVNFYAHLMPTDTSGLDAAFASIPDDVPATIPWTWAQAYAERVGARLPTLPEARIAPRAVEGDVFAEAGRGRALLAQFEWTSTPGPDDLRSRVGLLLADTSRWSQLSETGNVPKGAVVRRARSAERP